MNLKQSKTFIRFHYNINSIFWIEIPFIRGSLNKEYCINKLPSTFMYNEFHSPNLFVVSMRACGQQMAQLDLTLTESQGHWRGLSSLWRPQQLWPATAQLHDDTHVRWETHYSCMLGFITEMSSSSTSAFTLKMQISNAILQHIHSWGEKVGA